LCHARNVVALEHDAPGARVDEPQERAAEGALSAARLTHQTESLAGVQREANILDCAQDALLAREQTAT
jgi:hypothetical protein